MKQYTLEELKALERDSWSEDDFIRLVISHAKGYGFKVAHFRPAKTARGWRTAVQGDGKGFPDLVGIRRSDGKSFAWELKVKNNPASEEQIEWLAFFFCVGFDARICRPRDWDSMMNFLEKGKR